MKKTLGVLAILLLATMLLSLENGSEAVNLGLSQIYTITDQRLLVNDVFLFCPKNSRNMLTYGAKGLFLVDTHKNKLSELPVQSLAYAGWVDDKIIVPVREGYIIYDLSSIVPQEITLPLSNAKFTFPDRTGSGLLESNVSCIIKSNEDLISSKDIMITKNRLPFIIKQKEKNQKDVFNNDGKSLIYSSSDSIYFSPDHTKIIDPLKHIMINTLTKETINLVLPSNPQEGWLEYYWFSDNVHLLIIENSEPIDKLTAIPPSKIYIYNPYSKDQKRIHLPPNLNGSTITKIYDISPEGKIIAKIEKYDSGDQLFGIYVLQINW